MKKTIYLFGLLLLAGATVFTSCKKDEDEEPTVDMTPVLTFIGGAGYTDADATIAPSSTFKVGINASWSDQRTCYNYYNYKSSCIIQKCYHGIIQ